MKKNSYILIYSFLLTGMLFMFTISCKKDDKNNSEVTVTDIDGNIYHTVTIGKQEWMVENLKVTKYNDGTTIPLVTIGTAWENMTTSGYCWYNNDEVTYKKTSGALYNWYAVNTDKLCPSGWHVPNDAEWTTMINYLGGKNIAGGKLKDVDSTLWSEPNTGATNESGFSAIPGGYRYGVVGGMFLGFGYTGYWWSSSELSSFEAWSYYLHNSITDVVRIQNGKKYGYSIRCIRD
jgi:uncharacterized protein (TIGR02145 family)